MLALAIATSAWSGLARKRVEIGAIEGTISPGQLLGELELSLADDVDSVCGLALVVDRLTAREL